VDFRIELLKEKKVVGKKLRMSLAMNRTPELWRSFMPRRRELVNIVGNDLFSIQVYDDDYFKNFSPENEIDKMAAVEVTSLENIPDGLQTLVIPSGLYAVFLHKGSSNDHSTFEYIFTQWLPKSDYVLDNRPHFEVLGEKYKNADPSSEEEIWIPIKSKP
jgi:AraC family transcriptional regulator